MDLRENINYAIRSVRGNALRAIITLSIIAFGIMALVGILTAIDSAIYSLKKNFAFLGTNTFEIRPSPESTVDGKKIRRGDVVSFNQAMTFKEIFNPYASSSVAIVATNTATLKYEDKKTNPNIAILGGDENYLEAKAYSLDAGRNFTDREAREGSPIVILGKEPAQKLFGTNYLRKALDAIVVVNGVRMRVVGLLKSKGNSMGRNEDQQIIIPLQDARRYYGRVNQNHVLLVTVRETTDLDQRVAEATGVFRNIRRLKATEPNNFEIRTSDGFIDIINENTATLQMAAIGIGIMTLLGAAIGLMNIMLVSVTERTREIGITKAIGATSRNIRIQFLTEAVIISLLGGIVGIVLGILLGNLVSLFMGGTFIVPWLWILISIVVCTAVGLLSGLYPAIRASRLDPIESLRYE